MQSRTVRRSFVVAAAAALVAGTMSATSYAATGNGNPMNVFVTNTADNPVPVAGSVNVANLPSTQTVNGTVNVGNLPATQTVSGTVGIDPAANTVDVDLSGEVLQAATPDTVVLLEEQGKVGTCTVFDMGCPGLGSYDFSFEADAANVREVRVMAQVVATSPEQVCADGPCVRVRTYSISPTGRYFEMDRHDIEGFQSYAVSIPLPGMRLAVHVEPLFAQDPSNAKEATVQVYVVGRG